LHLTVCIFVDVKQELGTPVLNLLLIALWRHCLPSLRCVSYPAPQSSVAPVGTKFVSMKNSHHAVNRSIVTWRTNAHTNMIQATWKHVNIHFRPYWENEVKYIINILNGCLISWF
jgi:hypothetical protein